MTTTETLPSKEELDFSYVYGTLFSLSATIEYIQAIQGLMAERKANYARNKARKAEIACQAVYNTLEREITKNMSPEQKQVSLDAIEHHKNTVYNFFLLSSDEQRRVCNLMDKLKKERK